MFTPLYEATWEGDTEIVRNLLKSKADPNKGERHTDEDGVVDVTTPLYQAAKEGYTEIVKGLIASGADPNKGYKSTDLDGDVSVNTPLSEAAEEGSIEIVKILLAMGARQDLDTGGGELGRSYIVIIIISVYHLGYHHQQEVP